MSKDIISHLGIPVAHEAITEAGQIVGRRVLATGPEVAETKWQPDMAALLIEHAGTIQHEIEQRGRTALAVHVLTEEKLQDWEVAVKHVHTAIAAHASAGANWVSCEHTGLEQVLAALFGADIAPKGTSGALQLARHQGQGRWHEILKEIQGSGDPTALKTEEGLALINGNAFGPTGVAIAEWVALTANNEAEKASSTALAGEIKTVSGGLIRKKASCTTVKGVSTITVTFTANGSDELPVTIHKFGIFNKAKFSEGGVLVIETKITEASFAAVADNVALTETITTT